MIKYWTCVWEGRRLVHFVACIVLLYIPLGIGIFILILILILILLHILYVYVIITILVSWILNLESFNLKLRIQ